MPIREILENIEQQKCVQHFFENTITNILSFQVTDTKFNCTKPNVTKKRHINDISKV